MNPAELLTHIRVVLAADAQLASWCTATFGKTPTIYLGYQEESETYFPQSEYPVIIICDIKEIKTDSFPGVELPVPFKCHIFQTGFDNLLKTYTGVLNTADFIEQIVDALVRARFSKIRTEKQIPGADRYPFFDGSAMLFFERIKIKRRQ